jgi:hypothetical protein
MSAQKIKGYKVMNPDSTCRGFKYEEGKSYKHDGNISMCNTGFHFCKELKDCYNYYGFDYKNPVYEVEGSGNIIDEEDKTVCSELKIIRRLELPEVLDLLNLFTSYNSGSYNMGSSNRGSYNMGSYNSGSSNSGSSNRGSDNRGSDNSGSYNMGSYNRGSDNRGSDNSGSYNRGSGNSGIYNYGSYSVGVFNYTSFIGEKDNCCCFNVKTGMSLMQFYRKYMTVLKEVKAHDFRNVNTLPGYTESKWSKISKYS